MKKTAVIVLVALLLSFVLCGCSATCHYCGNSINGDLVEANGRTYCSTDCYMNEMFFGDR